MQGQAADVEGTLSRRSRIKRVLTGETGVELQSLYIQAQINTPAAGTRDRDSLLESVVAQWLQKERRHVPGAALKKRRKDSFKHAVAGRHRRLRRDAGTKGKRKYAKRALKCRVWAGKQITDAELTRLTAGAIDVMDLDDEDPIFQAPAASTQPAGAASSSASSRAPPASS